MPRVRSLGTHDPRDAEIRAVIRGGMEREGLSENQDLADLLRVSRSTITERMRHPETFRISEIQRIVDKLDIPEDDLLRMFYLGRRGKR